MKRLLFLLFLLPLLLRAAGPPPGTYIVPSFFTTNGAKIYGTNGIAISSNAVTGIYIIDGSGVAGVSNIFNPNQFLVFNGTNVSIKANARLTNVVMVDTTTFGSFFIDDTGTFDLNGGRFEGDVKFEQKAGDPSFNNWLFNSDGSGQFSGGLIGFNNLGTIQTTGWALNADGSGNIGATLITFTTTGEMNGTGLTWQWLHTTKGITNDGPYVGSVLTNTFTDILGTGQIALTNGVANQIAKFKSIQPGSGMLATNQGTNVVFAWDHTMTNGLATTNYVNSVSQTNSAGISIQTNAFGGTVGSATNLVLLTTTNINLTATNTATGGGTNSASFDTAQAITTNASPQFLNEMIHVDLMLAKGASNRLSTQKSRAWMLTNFLGGYGAWQTVTPMPVRRQWFYAYDRQNGVGAIGLGDVSSIGSLNNVNCTTNAWPQWSYTTGSSITSNGIQGNSLNVLFPGKNIFFATEGRVSLITTQRTWIGLTSGTSVSMGNTDTPTTLSVAALRMSSSAAGLLTNWSLVTCDGTGCTATDGPISLTTTNRHVFEVMEDRANVRWLAYIDGTAVATNTGNLPIAAMQPIMMITSLGAESAKTIFGSCLYHEQDNRQDTGNITPNP